MKISVEKREKNLNSIGLLRIGEVFYHFETDSYYLKIDTIYGENDSDINAIRLMDSCGVSYYEYACLDDNILVEPVEAELTITHKR